MTTIASREKNEMQLTVESKIALNMLNTEYFTLDNLFLRPDLLESAAKLLEKARTITIDGNQRVLSITEMLRLAAEEMKLKNYEFVDKIFILNLIAAKDSSLYPGLAGTDAIIDWIRYYHPNQKFPNDNPLAGDNLILKKFSDRYAILTIGQEKKESIETNAGVTWFLRYPPQMLEDTYKFFSGDLKSGEITLFLGPDTDYNGAFYQLFTQFNYLGSRDKTHLIAMEAFQQDEFIVRMIDAANILRRNKKLERKNFIIAGHGDPKSIRLGKGRTERDLLDIDDEKKEIFLQIKNIWDGLKFENAIAIACSAGKITIGKDGKDEEPIANYLSGTISETIHAMDVDGMPGLDLDKNGLIIAHLKTKTLEDGVYHLTKLKEITPKIAKK